MPDSCIFCRIVEGSVDSSKVYEDESVYAFLDASPINEYHAIVIPKDHYENIFDIPESQLSEVASAIKGIAKLFQNNLGIDNVQVLHSSGQFAQQEVDHFHMHIVPRHKDDGKDIKVPTHPELRARFDELIEKLEKNK